MPDTILTGGTVLTVGNNGERAESLLLRDGHVAAVGPDRSVRSEALPGAVVVDLAGRTVVPGFNDAHLHLVSLGQFAGELNLHGLSKREILEQLREYAEEHPAVEWLVGVQWDYPYCPDPHRSDLDAIVPDRPVFLLQFSGHAGWANSEALRRLKIRRDTPDWEHGGADRDEHGELTGILREPVQWPGVMKLWKKQAFEREAIRSALPDALRLVASYGITSVQDNTWSPRTLAELASLHRRGELTCRISCWTYGPVRFMDTWLSLSRFKPPWYRRGARKYFLDGAFSSHTAWMTEPYNDKPETAGKGMPAEQIRPLVRRASRQRRQLACHSIGDAATGAYVDAMEAEARRSRAELPRTTSLRHRIEHGQLIRAEDLPRIRELGMVVSAQPNAAADPDKDAGLLGPERAARAYPYRDLLDADIPLAFGSDFPGERTFNPLFGIHVAVNRDGGQAIAAREALRCYTRGSAYAEFAESEKGRLEPGCFADLAVLSDDPTSVAPDRIKDITVDATAVDGRVVYVREAPEHSRYGPQSWEALGELFRTAGPRSDAATPG